MLCINQRLLWSGMVLVRHGNWPPMPLRTPQLSLPSWSTLFPPHTTARTSSVISAAACSSPLTSLMLLSPPSWAPPFSSAWGILMCLLAAASPWRPSSRLPRPPWGLLPVCFSSPWCDLHPFTPSNYSFDLEFPCQLQLNLSVTPAYTLKCTWGRPP